jgi:hypothetical protein
VVDGNVVGYCYTFAGTQNGQDAWQDLKQLVGISGQYDDANDAVQALTAANLAEPLSFTGHSLGGGLASLAAFVIRDNAITFNAAGLSDATMKEFGVYGQSQDNISAYIVVGDRLNSFQQASGLYTAQAIVHNIASTVTSLDPTSNHRIDTVIASLQHEYQINPW